MVEKYKIMSFLHFPRCTCWNSISLGDMADIINTRHITSAPGLPSHRSRRQQLKWLFQYYHRAHASRLISRTGQRVWRHALHFLTVSASEAMGYGALEIGIFIYLHDKTRRRRLKLSTDVCRLVACSRCSGNWVKTHHHCLLSSSSRMVMVSIVIVATISLSQPSKSGPWSFYARKQVLL